MGIDEVLKLINLLQDTDVQEVEVAEGDRRIKIVRMGPKSRVDDNSIPSAESSSVNIKNSEEDVEKSETNEILDNHNEVFNIDFQSKKFLKYSKFNFNGNYDLISDTPNEYTFGYSYFDECFGINLDFKRNFYIDGDLKPQDILTLMFSFKNLGAYKSTNLAVSEQAKQDIQWENYSIDNDQFE